MTELAIVIPVFNEQMKIAADIRLAAQFLNEQRISGEIIVVDDGSTDNTAQNAAQSRSDINYLKVISYRPHRGKGYAVKTGILASSSDYVMFIDSGSCVDYSDVLKGFELLKTDQCDIAHGSRHLALSRIKIPQSWIRRLTSRLFRFFARMLLGLPKSLTDSQIGLKMYKGRIGRELYAQVKTPGFLFDIEVIAYASEKGLRIREFPIEWTCDLDSRLGLRSNFIRTVREMIQLRTFLRKLKTH